MHIRHKLAGGAAVTLLMSTTAGFADVTPEEVWASWQSYLEAFGYEVTADETRAGDTLTVSGLTMKMALPEDAGTVTATIGDMSYVDQGNGTVRVQLPDSMPITIHAVPAKDAGDEVQATLNYTTQALDMLVSGTPEAMTYAYSAASVGVSLGELLVNGEPEGNAKADVSIQNIAGTSTRTTGDVVTLTQEAKSGPVTYDIAIISPDAGSFLMKGQVNGLESASDVAYPENIDLQNMAAAMQDGFRVSGEMKIGGGNSEFSFSDGQDNASGTTATTGSVFNVAMDSDHLRYGISSTGVQVSVMGSGIPFPINVEMAETGFDLSMPVTKSETPQDFSLLIKLIGLAPDDMIWGIADPGAILPHDPADLVIDLAGKANWQFDIFDPEQVAAAESGDTMPAELHNLTIKDLRLAVAGAELTGIGDFAFDMSDLTTFDGMPAPEGKIDLRLLGGNGLMDNLITMGLMTEDDAMGARMMMGLFGRPGEGDDELLSTIEVKKTGEVSANGQRLQ